MKRTLLFFSIVFAVCACADSEVTDTTTAKGEESALPEDAKDDSFRKPTEHGELKFGLTNQGELTADERFHTWTFTLTGGANVTLRVETFGDKNLDTVMYLYRRDPGAETWGSYMKRNDDHEQNVWSQLDLHLDAGEYRVLVKGYKTKLRGSFGVKAECAGTGCPTTGDAPDVELPASTSMTAECFERINKVVTSEVVGGSGFSIMYETDAESLTGVERKAVELYKQYWDDIGCCWDEMDFEGHELDVGVQQTEDGAIAVVDYVGGDETTITFLFDGQENLLLLHHDEQSPTVDTFCGEDGAPFFETFGNEDCIGRWLDYMPHSSDDAGEVSGTVRFDELPGNDELPKLVRAAVETYEKATGVAHDTDIAFEFVSWEADFGTGAEVTLSADGAATLSYTMGNSDFDSLWIFMVTEDGSQRFLCQDD